MSWHIYHYGHHHRNRNHPDHDHQVSSNGLTLDLVSSAEAGNNISPCNHPCQVVTTIIKLWWWWWWWWCWWWWLPKLESNIEKSGLEWFWFCAAPSRPKLTRTIWIWMSSSDFLKMPSWHHSDTDVFVFGIPWFCWEVEIVSRPCSEVQRENLYLSCKSSVVQLVPQFDRGAKSRLLSFSLAQK